MWGTLRDLLTSDGAKWHETLPFVVGFLFVGIELVIRHYRARQPVFHVPALTYILGEGIFVTIVLIYGLALAFNKLLAIEVAERNGKVLAVAMFVAFATLAAHIYRRWFSKGHDHE